MGRRNARWELSHKGQLDLAGYCESLFYAGSMELYELIQAFNNAIKSACQKGNVQEAGEHTQWMQIERGGQSSQHTGLQPPPHSPWEGH